jgi:tetratricopeptide (TPR) repeat protein
MRGLDAGREEYHRRRMTMTRPRRTPYGGMTGIAISVVAAMCLLIVGETSAQPTSVWESRMRTAETATEDGRLADAEAALREGLAEVERLDPEDPRVATALNALAIVAAEQGRLAERIALGRRALAIRERQLGPTHPDVAIALGNLAGYHALERNYAEATGLYQRALAIQELALGPESASTVATVRNLAGLYVDRRRYAEAQPLVARVVRAREQTAGADHPVVAAELNNLAEMYRLDGRAGGAEPLYRGAVAIQEKALGVDHLELAIVMGNLAKLYAGQGKLAQAEPLYRRVLAIREKALGSRAPGAPPDARRLCRRPARPGAGERGRRPRVSGKADPRRSVVMPAVTSVGLGAEHVRALRAGGRRSGLARGPALPPRRIPRHTGAPGRPGAGRPCR